MALFGEKYGDRGARRSRSATGRASCAAARHAERSGQLGVIKLLGESSIGSGVRRVEALVGADAYRFLAREHVLVAPALRGAQGAARGAARAGQRHRRAAAGRREGAGAGADRPAAGAGRRARGRRRRRQRRPAWSACASTGADGGDVRTMALDLRGRLQPGAARRGGAASGSRTARCRSWPRPTTRRVRAGVRANDVLARGRCRWSAAGAAARTTSPRAAAPTRRASTRRSRLRVPRSARPPVQAADDAPRRTARHRPR